MEKKHENTELVMDDGKLVLRNIETKKVIATTLRGGECMVLSELLESDEFTNKLRDIYGIIFVAKNVYSWNPDKMQILRDIRIEARSLLSVKQANNWADKALARLHYEFPY